jgi:hypothetical protein
MDFDAKRLAALAQALEERYGHLTRSEFDRTLTDLMRRTEKNKAIKAGISLSRIIRGLRIKNSMPALNEETAAEDVKYMESVCQKALTTQGTPGSVLVPVIQADTWLEYLNLGGVARASGVRIWEMDKIQKMNIPQATAAPSWVWSAQSSQTTAVDPNLSAVSFDLTAC